MKKTLLSFMILFSSFSYSQTFDGNLGSKSLNWNNDQKDFNSPPRVGVNPMSIRLWDNYHGINAPSEYGSLLELYGQHGHLVSHLYFDNTWNGGRILYRSAFYAQNTWESWRYLLDSKSDIESSGNLKISGNGNNYIVNGNVGIGTVSPDSKLTVAGNIHAQEVKVTINAGKVPDYVFANDYKLKPLQEVEKYIKENNHLPEIPSAKEIENNGLMLAEMNMNLLKKIEELTLHTIEQQKDIKQLIKVVEEQSKRLNSLENK
ncbi:tail fiber protein [Flavobacterium sp. F-65]|uniref:Tail fiber protein n=1 Tax=Flavobacterium pisciphilum TaxID=2893755 RepID=A0ABS8MNH7_9FLAO|nr:tail fiber protein [Flavobacterium sp. F-65]MCC9070324.1 tail fiber protein [Flavobacterium sp. F-65]